MIGHYDISMADRVVGSADVTKEGLYYRFYCRCRLTGDIMHQINAVCGGKEYSLGICVPMHEGFGIETKVPVKTIGEGVFSFYVTPRHKDIKGRFAPIRSEEPFSYIERLKNARLGIHNGEYGALFDDEDQPDI